VSQDNREKKIPSVRNTRSIWDSQHNLTPEQIRQRELLGRSEGAGNYLGQGTVSLYSFSPGKGGKP